MALNADKLKCVIQMGDHSFFHYYQDSATTGAGGTSGDAVATVAGSGYFNNATNNLKKGDVIFVVDEITGTGATIDFLIVTSATGAAVVTTTNVTV